MWQCAQETLLQFAVRVQQCGHQPCGVHSPLQGQSLSAVRCASHACCMHQPRAEAGSATRQHDHYWFTIHKLQSLITACLHIPSRTSVVCCTPRLDGKMTLPELLVLLGLPLVCVRQCLEDFTLLVRPGLPHQTINGMSHAVAKTFSV